MLPDGVDPGEACDSFNACGIVELAWPMLKPQPLPLPDNLVPDQGYLNEATDGIGALAAWTGCPTRGEGVRIADIEYSWNLDHQEETIHYLHEYLYGTTAV